MLGHLSIHHLLLISNTAVTTMRVCTVCIDATLLKEISLDADGITNDVEYSLPEVDVTGGMASKLTRASNIAQMNIPVFVVGSSAEEIRQACTEGKTNGKGTKIFSTSPTSPK